MKAIGLDIGTTTICGVVLETENGMVLYSETRENDTTIDSPLHYEKIQDPNKILMKIQDLLKSLLEHYSDAVSIGLTGQMHGILYVNTEGAAVSPLYTWQDERGNEQYGTSTYAEYLTENAGYFCASGFGLTTHFYNQVNHLVPKEAVKICTIHDFAAMHLAGGKTPMTSPSDAASMGIFDLKNLCFDKAALKKIEISETMLPILVEGFKTIGFFTDPENGNQIPVSVGIGDNQASVIGSVTDVQKTVLVNIGTGSQISMGVSHYIENASVELRPYTSKDYIFAGSCLCGGRAYAALKKFYGEVLEMAGVTSTLDLYAAMAKVLEKSEKTDVLTVSPKFCGTRENPEERGSITGISLDNFTPKALTEGFLYGIAGELHGLYLQIHEDTKMEPEFLVGSGNGIRKNLYLKRALENLFGKEMKIPAHNEEASYGAALFSLVSAGYFSSLTEAQKMIHYL